MLVLGGCLVLALAFSQATAYTLMAPKIYGQSIPNTRGGWASVVYPFRTYQPPPQYYGRYYNDPYFAPNMQNPDYIYGQDPYTAPFDDSDYYSNYLTYYIPSRRMYYEQPLVDTVDDIQDYDDEAPEEDNNFKLQRDWWLEKNVMPSEDTDFDRFQFDDFMDYKVPKSTKKTKNKELRKSMPKPRYAGIDGFGRKKDKEQVFGRFQFNPRRDDEPMYAESTQSEDKDVKELKNLYKETGRKEAKIEQHGESSLDDWMRGHVKKSTDGFKHRHQQPWTKASYDPLFRYEDGVFAAYNEGGQMKIPDSSIQQEERWVEYAPEETSVFDTIKKLLALEDDSDQKLKIKKRGRQSTNCKTCSLKSTTSTTRPTSTPTTSSTTVRQFPDFESQSTLATVPKQIKNHKRSAISGKKQLSSPTDEESLVRELSALPHRKS